MSTLHSLLAAHAAERPHRSAYTFVQDDVPTTRTWSEMQERAAAVAGQLRDLGVAPGERVLLAFPEGLAYLDAFFGCLIAGAIAVPVHPPDPSRLARTLPRLEAIAADCTPTLVLTTEALREALATHLAVAIAAPAPSGTSPSPAGPGLAYLQYTSGSTADPKGVCIHHRHLLHQLRDFDTGYAHTEDAVIVSWLPATHDLGLVYGRLMGLYKGMHTVFFAPGAFMQRPRRWLELLTTWGGTHSPSPNFGFEIAARKAGSLEGLDLSRVRVLLNGAEPIRRRSELAFRERFAPCGLAPTAITHAMGMSETTAKIVTEPIARMAQFLTVDAMALAEDRVVVVSEGSAGAVEVASNGGTVLDTRLRIVDPERRTDLGSDRVGELWVSGSTVAAGYWQRAEATAETFEAQLDTGEGPFLRTGDLGFLREGELYLVGRLKDVLIVRGQNHHAPDLEWALHGVHAALRPNCAAAFSVPDVGSGDGIAVVAEIGSSLDDPRSVFRAIRGALSELGLSADHLCLIPPHTLPKTSSGKLKRHAARSAFLDGSLRTLHRWDRAAVGHPEPAQGPRDLEQGAADAIGQIAAELLGLESGELDTDVPFRELGLDSITAVELITRLSAVLGQELRPSLLFDHPTIDRLATALGPAAPPQTEVADMSDAEVEAALLAELEDL